MLLIHDVEMDEFVSKKREEYVKCPHIDCLLFALKTEVIPYMKTVHYQLHREKQNNSGTVSFVSVSDP